MASRVTNAVDAGEGDIELRALRQRLATDAKDLDARVLLARRYMELGVPDLALEHYRLASALFPDSAVAALGLAKTLRQMGAREEALKALEGYLAGRPDGGWEPLTLKGILLDELNRLPAGEAAHRAALALDGNRSALHNNLGYNLFLQGKLDAAVDELRRAVELDPKSGTAHNNLGTALAAREQSPAEEVFSEWRQSADPAVAHNNMAAVLMEQGRYAAARPEIEAALALRPGLPAALVNMKLAVEAGGPSAAAPAASQTVSWPKRLAARWTRIFGSKPANKPGESGSEKGAPAESSAALGARIANPGPADIAERK